jgi:hypothetical protein
MKQPILLIGLCALAGCGGRSQFQKGYEKGAADAVKRQYWIEQSLQKPGKNPEKHLSIYKLTIPPDPDPGAKVKRVPYEIGIPIVN